MASPEGPLPASLLPRPVREFLHAESAGGILLLVAAVVALVWANSPFADSYEHLWETEVVLEAGPVELHEHLVHWVNDLLMALFFFVVGLEIKRELVVGELRTFRTAALPVVGALGGMAVPALIYLAVNVGQPGAEGWGIPMATDIAFAVGVLALLGSRTPPALKLFLLTLAIVDDLGAILVIAIFYSSGVALGALAGAIASLVVIGVLRAIGVRWVPPYVLLGLATWYFTFESGVHATIAGVALAFMVPVRPIATSAVVKDWVDDLSQDPTAADVAALTRVARLGVSPAERLQHALHPWTSFFVVPVFALANAGVSLEGGIEGDGAWAVAVGVFLGLVVGKLAGIVAACWLAVRTGVASLPLGVGWGDLAGGAALAGIGFTVSIFVAGLAFDDADLTAAAKVAILAASLAASLLGAALVAIFPRPAKERAKG